MVQVQWLCKAAACVSVWLCFYRHLFVVVRTSVDVSVPALSKGVLKRPFLQPLDAISPVGGGHAAVGVQQDPETPHYQQPQEHQ